MSRLLSYIVDLINSHPAVTFAAGEIALAALVVYFIYFHKSKEEKDQDYFKNHKG